MALLKIRGVDGNFYPIHSIKGEPGKSAYEQAVEGGYQGTEEEFIAILGGLSAYSIGTISEVDEIHCDDYNNPHKVTASQVGALPISGGDMKNAITWNNGKTSIVGQPDGNLILRNMKLSDNGHDDFLAFHNELALENMLRVYRDGVPYAVYGHHNKPKALDVGAIPSTIGSSDSTLKIDIGNHVYVHDKYDAEVPEIPVVSNFTHYITINASGKVTAVLSIPIDYTNKAFYYTYQDKSWHEIADASQTPRFASGTYIGTGGGGESQPNSLTFPFKPKMVYIALESPQTNRSDVTQPLMYGSRIGLVCTSTSTNWGSHNTYPLNLTWNGNTLTWTYTLNTSSVEQHQLNISGSTYSWVAFG